MNNHRPPDADSVDIENGVDKARFEAALQKPGQNFGYPQYVKALATAPNFQLVRTFERLNMGVILALQDQIVEIEEKVDNIDKENAYLINFAKVMEFYPADETDRESVKNWLANPQHPEREGEIPIAEKEREYIDKPDLVCLSPRTKSPLRELFGATAA
ncbi:uncharacterized protein BDV14DRAFT_194441 [Aspergillus stella-maris]|uniref:uncharacterized protein n=1 Tax=Aspergillus stella-maris TaxID=1810926 RepID=UPI003CCE1B65